MAQSSSISSAARTESVIVDGVSEEALNQLTHGIGFLLSLAGAVHLMTQQAVNLAVEAGSWIYTIALVLLFAASTLSHSFEEGRLREQFRTLDQVCIFIFMAAIFTPISLRACSDGWWNLPLIGMWAMAGIGTWLKLRVAKHEMVSVWFYLAMGALPMVTFTKLLNGLGVHAMLWILGAAVCFLVGTIFLVNDHRHRYFHPIWHVLVIMGCCCHYVVICNYAVPAV